MLLVNKERLYFFYYRLSLFVFILLFFFSESFVCKRLKRIKSKCKFLYNVVMHFKLYHLTHSHINE